jgi:hypothetical protein
MLSLIGALRSVLTTGISNRSLRIRSGNYLSKGVSAVSTEKLWTYSIWVKRGTLTGNQHLFSYSAGSTSYSTLYFTGDTLTYAQADAGVIAFSLVTTQVFRDPSAWYHIVLVYDSNQATASNRVKLYVNGSSCVLSGTYPSLSLGSYVTNPGSTAAAIGKYAGAAIEYFDGYIGEVNFVTGIALTPSFFGQINTLNGSWTPKKYTGTYNTNGFYLRFADIASIGRDFSGQGNSWTTNGISLTLGVTYDSVLDIPTNNYCVLNPIDKTTTATLGSGNLQTSSAASQNAIGSISMDSGSWYWEVSFSAATADQLIGVYKNTALAAAITPTTSVIGVSFNADIGELKYTTDGTTYSLLSNTATGGGYLPYVGSLTNAKIIYANFGQRPFTYNPPNGFSYLCSSSLPTPLVVNGASVMAATTYTGNAAARSISNAVNTISFQPDFVWIKGRSGATDHALYDVVRGTTKDLVSNSTAAETTQATGLTTFNADGFNIGALAKLNAAAATYIAWQWKAGGTAVSNTAGTITSQVSANTTAGFSVVTATKSASANCTIGHGLGVAPKMVIFKTRDSAADNWGVWHTGLAGTEWLVLNTTAAKSTNANIWNSTAPTSSVISIGTSWAGTLALAYCFAEIAGFSKFGSYTGNGSADGPFVYCGFRPRFIIVKASSTTGDWAMIDTTVNAYNVAGLTQLANTATTEGAALSVDILSNGFKIRSATLNNTSAATYVFAAFAENSIKYALAR